MPYTNPRHKARNQRQRRRTGYVKRLEVTLSADSDRDVAIHDHLAGLPAGTVSEFVKQSVAEKVQRERGQQPPQQAQSEASAQFAQLMQELAAQRREIAELREAVSTPVMVAAVPEPVTDRRRRIEPEARSAPPPDTASATGEVVSGGIDMSRPRRRRTAPTAATAHQADTPPQEIDERAQAALARELIRSIGAFGADR
ncbi:MAG: hypothetical protein K8S97_08530 [Anaerolineae bacterium]|nr:hypothetical protein [Anaerolineae bacterium]